MARLWVTVTPNARRDDVWQEDGSIRATVKAPARDGKANSALLRLVARALDVPPSSVQVVKGASARHKMVSIAGLDDGDVARRLAAARSCTSDRDTSG